MINKSPKKGFTFVLTGLVLVAAMFFGNGVLASIDEGVRLNEQLQEWQEDGIDVNHTEAIDKILAYIDENVEEGNFASLHIDRDERPLGIIVLSFKEEPSEDMKEEIKALIEEPAEVKFRVVRFTEVELMEKQGEINREIFEENVLEADEITVYYTSPNIKSNKVEIGISPYTEENIQVVYEHFDEDMVHVVEGSEAQLLTGSGLAEQEEGSPEVMALGSAGDMDNESTEEEKTSFFAKIINWILNLFNFS